jgi:hypothetical protein
MDNRSSPEISSFVLRFVQEKPVALADQPILRGSIRHIQTDQELSFTYWIDAVNFMSQFVPNSVFDLSHASAHLSEGCEEPK